jgi:hypothetical protein
MNGVIVEKLPVPPQKEIRALELGAINTLRTNFFWIRNQIQSMIESWTSIFLIPYDF